VARVLLAAPSDSEHLRTELAKVHHVYFGESLSDAVMLLRGREIDVVICTTTFDESRIFDLLRLIRSRREWKHIPIICVSLSHGRFVKDQMLQSVQSACKALGATAFVELQNDSEESAKKLLMTVDKLLTC